MSKIVITITLENDSPNVLDSMADDVLEVLQDAEMDCLLDFPFEVERGEAT